jgi:penicillin-binding protein 1A
MAGALAHSLNCATAYLMKQVGPAQFASFLERVNIPTKVDPYPSIALGACDLSLYEMMWAYSIFPGNGFSTKPYFISRIEDRNGNVIKRYDFSTNRKEVISEVTAYNMTRMMQGTVDRGTAAGLRTRLGAAEMGGKTGTTNDNADAWFLGYVPQLLAGVWIGSDDRFIRIESAQGYGGTAARPIWEAFFRKAYADKSIGLDKEAVFAKPADLHNEILNADINQILEEDMDNAEGDDYGSGNADDYSNFDSSYESIPAESKKPVDEDQPLKPKKDTTKKNPKIGDPAPAGGEKKKGILRSIFGKKDKEE